MNGPASFRVTSPEDAGRAIEYFNGFHDGFMKRVVIDSHDEIDQDLGQSCTGLFEVTIDFAHYNYAKGTEPFHPHNQIIRAEFRNVQDICFDFNRLFLGNSILSLAIVPVTRGLERCLGLRIGRHFYLEESRRYEFRDAQFFTFTDATFVEQAPADILVA